MFGIFANTFLYKQLPTSLGSSLLFSRGDIAGDMRSRESSVYVLVEVYLDLTDGCEGLAASKQQDRQGYRSTVDDARWESPICFVAAACHNLDRGGDQK